MARKDGVMEKAAVAPAWKLMRLLDGFVTTQLLYVAAKLGIADVLADGPRSGTEIADGGGRRPRTRWSAC